MRIVAALALLLVSGIASAQALRWNDDQLTWKAPSQTTCVDGSPLTECPITGYRIETSPTPTATTWTLVATVAPNVFTYLRTGAPAGQSCYRFIALATTNSAPSNAVCATAVAPAPFPPVPVTIDGIAYELRGTTTLSLARVGLVPLGVACGESRKIGTQTYYRLPRSAADLVVMPVDTKLTDVWAKCG